MSLFEPPAPDVAAHLQELAGLESDLGDVEIALRRLAESTYGTCETCGVVLTDMDAHPAARRCPAHPLSS